MSNYNILLVDDSPGILKALKRTLVMEEYMVFTAGGSDEALGVLRRERIDLIIADDDMPGGTGQELMRIARREYPMCFRILMSGKSDIEPFKGALENGNIHKYFQKPWDNEEMLRSISQIFAVGKYE